MQGVALFELQNVRSSAQRAQIQGGPRADNGLVEDNPSTKVDQRQLSFSWCDETDVQSIGCGVGKEPPKQINFLGTICDVDDKVQSADAPCAVHSQDRVVPCKEAVDTHAVGKSFFTVARKPSI